MDVPGYVPASPVISVSPVDVSVEEEMAPKEPAWPSKIGGARFTRPGWAIADVRRRVVVMEMEYFMSVNVLGDS